MSLSGTRSNAGTAEALVSLDLETTGLEPDSDDVIEVGAVKFRGPEVLGTFSTYVNPHRPIPPFVQGLTGITDADVGRAPPFASIAGDLGEFIGPHPVVGHNIGFDITFLNKKRLHVPGPQYDTLDLASILLPDIPSYSLSAVADALDIAHAKAHRAVNDATMAMNVFVKLHRLLEALDPALIDEMARIADRADWPLKRLFREASSAFPVSLVQQGEIGLEGVDLDALMERLKAKRGLTPASESKEVDGEMLRRILEEEGPLADALGVFEHREEQVSMARAVAGALNEGQRLIVEAGTGTGKSLAYLLPAAMFARDNGRRVVVSTNTINLQEQLIGKDIPAALASIQAVVDQAADRQPTELAAEESSPGDGPPGDELRFALLKGRANYLCLRRWAVLKRNESLSVAEAKTLIKVLLWMSATSTGDRGEINLTRQEAGVWRRLSAQGFDDQKGPCPFVRRGLCFYKAARDRAEAAHVLVINHALLALNAKHGSFLPEYSHLIIDEAHHLEDVATNQFGFSVDDGTMDEFLARLLGSAAGSGPGLLGPFRAVTRSIELSEGRRHDLIGLLDGLEADIQTSRQRLAGMFKQLSDFAVKHARNDDYEVRLLLSRGVRAQPAWLQVEISWEETDVALKRVADGLQRLHRTAGELDRQLGGKAEDNQAEASTALDMVQEFGGVLAAAVANPDETNLYWMTVGNQDGTVRLHGAPLHVGPALNEQLFSQKETSIITGATLSTEGNFEYVKERLQFEPSLEVLLGSPFDFGKLAMLYVPTDIPEPSAPGYQAALERTIADTARAAGGRTLVLFTSRAGLRTTRGGVRDLVGKDGITVLGQDIDGTPRQLLNTFRSSDKVVLLGTGSFWEGVDIAGEALSVLMIARLPFGVPSEPVFAARCQQIDDPFAHYAIPQAVLRFKQGFGRLIRRKTDRGVFVVLDRRVFSKSYGRAFLDSIPPCTRKLGPAAELPAAAVQWLSQRHF